METARRTFGNEGEGQATDFLRRRGFRILERNARVPRIGEIDIVALDGSTLVFVEVKTRRDRAFGPPEEAVTPAKFRTLARCADAWRASKGWTSRAWRIDAVAIDLSDGRGEIRHLENVALE